MEAWAQGRYGEAIGRGTFEVVSMVVGGKGLDKLGKLKKFDELIDIKRVEGKLGDVIDAARQSGTLDDVLDLGKLSPDEIKELVRLKKLSPEEANRAKNAAIRDGAKIEKPKKPYSNPKNRPPYAEGQVDEVWENAKQPDGNVYDPNTGEKLEWDKLKPRSGQWDMGHKPGREYRKLHKDYMDGKISKEEFLKEYQNPDNYLPESPSANRSRQFEDLTNDRY